MQIRLVKTWRRYLLPGTLVLLLLTASGCVSDSMRYVFTYNRIENATPDTVGLPYEDVWFPATDGVSLHGWFIPGSRPGPLLFFCHGNAANISYRVDILDYFHTRLGLPVFIFDYRGYGKSTGTPQTEADLYFDARGALAELARRGWNPAQMVFLGRSLGAGVALQMALEEPPAGLVLESPFTSLRDMAWRLRPLTFALFGALSFGDPYDNLAKIPGLKVPLLIIQGDQDRIVPPTMPAELYRRAPQPKRRVVVVGAGHSDSFQVAADTYLKTWEEFLASLTPPPSVP